MLRLEGVSKSYKIREGGRFFGKFRYIKALDHVSLAMRTGETLALLGVNGAGKSTLSKIAAGMVKPTEGRAILDGVEITQNIINASRMIGVVLGPSLVYNRLLGRQYLRFFAQVYRVQRREERIVELARMVGLEDMLDAYIESYSTGMKMRISLARALLHDPPFLVLDEFTMGLDPLAADRMRQLVKGLGKTVLLTTHNPREAEVMADRVAFISKGRLTAVDTPSNLVKRVTDQVRLSARVKDVAGAQKALQSLVSSPSGIDPAGNLELSLAENEISDVTVNLAKFGLISLRTKEARLEDAYSAYTGESLPPQVHSGP